VEPRRDLFQVEKIARLFIEVLLDCREQKKYNRRPEGLLHPAGMFIVAARDAIISNPS
jgi:hypothetical protein